MTWAPLVVLLSSAAAIVANVSAQMVAHAIVFAGSLQKSLFAGVSFGLVTLAAVLGLLYANAAGTMASLDWGHGVAALVVYLAASFTFLCVVAASETSVRFQIMRVLATSPQGLTPAELDETYSDQHIVGARLERLLQAGVIERQDGAYRLRSRSLLMIARTFLMCRLLLFGVRSEFEAPR
jgi:hypothetical protein